LDGTVLGIQSSGGISRYVAELSRSLSTIEADFVTFCGLSMNAYFAQIPRNRRIGLAGSTRWPGRGSVNRALNSYGWGLIRGRGSVTHSTYYYTRRGRSPHVQTVYDCIDEHDVRFFGTPLARAKRRSIEESDAIICISEQTRKDVLYHYDVDPSSTHVVYLGINRPKAWSNDPHGRSCTRRAPNESHLLFVGNRSGYKNFDSLLHALANPLLNQRGTVLHLVGGGPLTTEETRRIADLGLSADMIRFEGNLDPTTTGWYRRVDALVYPSLQEGFGLPPLEALANGCAVVAADTPISREVLGGAAQLFDAQRLGSLTQTLLRVIDEPELSEWTLLPRDYSWEACAIETLNVYQSLIS
jgi:glycosyltransferase involved in cell wall biosynthesis